MGYIAVLDVQVAGEQVEELAANVLVGAGFAVALVGEKLREVGIEQAVGDEVAEALEEIGGVGYAALREANALLAAVDAEERFGFGIEEVAEVFREDHGDAREIAQCGDDSPGLKLRKEAGREAGVAAEIDQTHGLLQAQVLNSLTDALLGDECLGCFTINLQIREICKRFRERVAGFRDVRGLDERVFVHEFDYINNFVMTSTK